MRILLHKKGIVEKYDFFEKLDDSRIENLLQFVCNQVRSQVFLTHTSTEKLQHHLKKTKEPYEIIEIKAT